MALDPAPRQVPLSALCVGGGREGVWRVWGGSCSLENLSRDFSSPAGQGCTTKVNLVLFSKAVAGLWEGLNCVLAGAT